MERAIKAEGQVLLGWRDVPVNRDMPMSPTVREKEPILRQIFIGRGNDVIVQDALERKLYVIRKTASAAIQRLKLTHSKEYYVPSMSSRTVVYKGLLLADQVGTYFMDLTDARCVSALGLVHQRFSTNTFPEWPLAHPYRYVAHNGEINTVKGNYNWMKAREGVMSSPVLGADLQKLYPISFAGQSDTATFDNCLELLTMAGYPISQAVMMMIPEPWEQHTTMDERRKAFYEYHAAMLEPWDGPASIVFTDGRQIGATLDRNGLRPSRYCVTDDDLVIMASESGVLPIPENKIVRKWRLQPGKMFLIDLEQGRMIDDEEIKADAGQQQALQAVDREPAHPAGRRDRQDQGKRRHGSGSAGTFTARPPAGLRLHPGRHQVPALAHGRQRRGSHRLHGQRQPAGRAVEQEQAALQLLQAAVRAGDEPADRPDPRSHRDVAGVLHRPQAQPAGHQPGQPADAARSQPAGAEHRRHGQSCATSKSRTQGKFKSYTLDITYPLAWGREGVEAKLASLCAEAVDAIKGGNNILIVSDRALSATQVAIPALLALSAIHQHLVREGLRTTAGLVVETGTAQRSASLRRAGRLRRRGGSPLPGAWKPWPSCPKACRAT